jgi:hypothetical protein
VFVFPTLFSRGKSVQIRCGFEKISYAKDPLFALAEGSDLLREVSLSKARLTPRIPLFLASSGLWPPPALLV